MSDDEGGSDRPTLIRPPPKDPDKAPIENALEVLELSVIGPVRAMLPLCPPSEHGGDRMLT